MSEAAGAERSDVVNWGRKVCSRVRRWPQNQEHRVRHDGRDKTGGTERKSRRKT